MRVIDFAKANNIDANLFVEFLKSVNVPVFGGDNPIVDDKLNFPLLLQDFKAYSKNQMDKRIALSKMLITSGFTFDGYRITKYSGYISGDDAIQVQRGVAILGASSTNVGCQLTDSLVKIRRRALQELKEAAYDLGCNAVIGVDFDYITLEPETASLTGHTTYLPYVFCVTANGNAVVIEKDEYHVNNSDRTDFDKGKELCPSCGTLLNNGSLYCHNCGTKLNLQV